MNKFIYSIAAAAMAALVAGPSWAGSLASSKTAFTFGDLAGLGAEACSQAGLAAGNCVGGGAGGAGVDDTGYVDVMQTFIKTANNKELALDVALQCALITYTDAKKAGNGGSGGSNASGRIVVRVRAAQVDNNGVEIPDTETFALPDNDTANVLGFADGAVDHDGVTYCYRFQELKVSYDNFLCLYPYISGNPADDCVLSVSLLLETLEAHAFNFLLPNVASGNWKLTVQARALADSNIFNADSSARGEAFVGLGSMDVEAVRLVKAYNPYDGPIYEFVDLDTGN